MIIYAIGVCACRMIVWIFWLSEDPPCIAFTVTNEVEKIGSGV